MVTFLLFIILIILIFWIAAISKRLSRLEKRQPGFSVPVSELPNQQKITHIPAAVKDSFSTSVKNAVPIPPPDADSATTHVSSELENGENKNKIKKSDFEVEASLATNWASKIGVVAILLGLGFFFKYAVDQGWIVPGLRIAIGFLVGGLFVVLGWIWREKYEKYANVIMGGGIAIIFFTIYAGYNFYGIFPQSLALVFGIVVSAVTVWLARLRNSNALMLLGLIGAYGSPVAISSGHNKQIQLFVYLAALNISIFLVIIKNYWVDLLYVGFLGTILDFILWGYKYSGGGNEPASAIFLAIIISLFAVGSMVVLRKHHNANSLPEKFQNKLGVFVFFANFVFAVLSYLMFYNDYKSYLVLISIIAGIASFIAYAIVDRLEFKFINYVLSVVGAGMIIAALMWQFHDKTLALSLILVSLLGVVVSTIVKRVEIRVVSVVTLFLAMAEVLVQSYGPEKFSFIFNAKFGLMALEVAAVCVTAWLYKFFPATPAEKNTPEVLQVAGATLLWFALANDATKAYPGILGQQIFTFIWILYPAILLLVAKKFNHKPFAILSMVMLLASSIATMVLPYGPFASSFITNMKFGLMTLQTIVILFAAYEIKENNELLDAKIEGFLLGGAALFFWVGVSWDLSKSFSGLSGAYAITLWWILYPLLLALLSSVMLKKSLVYSAVILMIFGFFKSLTVPYDAAHYSLIWNAKFGLMALEALSILGIAGYINKYESLSNSQTKDSGLFNSILKVAASLFFWFAFSWEIIQYFSNAFSSNTRNLSLSVWWIVYAAILITIGALGKSPIFRKVAIGLFLVSILKVFLYDVQTLDTAYRIVSFIVLGVILLLVSFSYQRNKEKIKEFLEKAS